jgi:DNA-binding transcriptional regulator YdaS (Cro superfamily)
MTNEVSPIERAIQAVGGEGPFREMFGIERRTFFYWKKGRIPVERVPAISEATGIPRHELCPEFWDAPSESAEQVIV